ncbi:MAG: sialidase family protein [Lachnospiraceae bacterium]|nr:sialidase family protein [Lachnospiraceae bacterium]
MKAVNFEQEFLAGQEEKGFESGHASTLVETKNHVVVAAWFGGSWEKGADVAIWMSRRVDGIWETPRKAAEVRGTAMWNPVLFQKKDGTIQLFYKVGETIAEWKTWYMESGDEGVTFTEPRELVPGDVSGGRGPVKNKPIRLADGTVLAPASLEGGCWDAFVDISKDDGETWEKSELVPVRRGGYDIYTVDQPYNKYRLFGKGIIQPTLWQDGEGAVHMFLRSTSSRIFRSDSVDGGRTWSMAYDTGLPNNNSGIDLTKLPNGDLILVYNPRENLPNYYKGPRTPLTVAVSKDNGKSFEKLMDLETGHGNYCYPSVICNEQNEVMITYTWNRDNIVFCKFQYEE